jgi:hypothetical protein
MCSGKDEFQWNLFHFENFEPKLNFSNINSYGSTLINLNKLL